jgi:choline dehydrogenase
MNLISFCACVASFATFAVANYESPFHLKARQLLGSSFGIPGDNATFDYIVVGGGNAGLAIAARLAEKRSVNVAVIEAGSFYEISNGNLSEVPAYDGVFDSKGKNDWQPLVDWGFMTTPQEVSLIGRARCEGFL